MRSLACQACCAPSARTTSWRSSTIAQAPEGVHLYRLSCISREEHPQFATVEVRTDYMRCGHVVFTADELLSDHVRATHRVAPAREFLCRLLRCVDAGVVTDRDAEQLSALSRLDPLGVAKQVERFWRADREGGVVLRAAASGDWVAARAMSASAAERAAFSQYRSAAGVVSRRAHPHAQLVSSARAC